MRRREFIGLAGGVLALPVVAWAQSKLPLVAFMDLGSFTKDDILRGMKDNGFVEGTNFRGEDSWGDLQPSLLAAQAMTWVQRQPTLIIANGNAGIAAAAATQSIPIVTYFAVDPVSTGRVESLNRPGGNVTGVSALHAALIAKRLEILVELIPTAKSVAYLGNSTNPILRDAEIAELEMAARTLGVKSVFLNASSLIEITAAFASLARNPVDAVITSADLVFWMNRSHLASLARSHKLPIMSVTRYYTTAGGLISYGTRNADGFYAIGVYAARILRGEKPSELPVQQITKTELAINLNTAKALGINVPPTLLARADEVIE